MATIKTSIQLHDGMSSTLRNMNSALMSTINAFEQMQTAAANPVDTQQWNEIRRQLSLAEHGLDQYDQSVRDALNGQNQLNNSANNGANAFRSMAKAVGTVVAAIISFRQLGKLVDISDEYANTTARIAMMNDGLQTTAELQERIYRAAKNSLASYSDTARMVARLGNNSSAAFSSAQEVVDFAELIQKQFSIAGTSGSEASNAMLQLSQALASGVLRGDELNSIFEQAPNIIQNIAKYLDVPIGKIRIMAKDGELTAQVVKEAMFAASDDINAKFNSMPMTWSSIWTTMVNYTRKKLNGVSIMLNNLFNSETFQTFQIMATQAIDAVVFGLTLIILTMTTLANWVAFTADFFMDNWTLIAPILIPIAVILGGILAILIAKFTWLALVKTATLAWAAAQWVVNAAYLASPTTWIILGIVAAIALVIYATYTWGEQTATVIGFINGLFAVLIAFIWNNFVGVINSVIQFLWSNFVEPWISIIEWVLNVFNGGFNSFGDAVANLLGQIISWFLSLGKVVTKIVDAIFGTNWTAGLSNLQASVTHWGKNETAITLDRNAPSIDSRIGYGDAYNSGYEWGYQGTLAVSDGLHSLMDKVKGFGPGNPDSALSGLLNGYGLGDGPDYLGALNDILDATNKGAKAAGLTADELEYLRDQVAREGLTQFNNKEIKVDVKNENYISSEMDIDGVIDRMGERIEAVAETLGEEDLVDV